MKRTDIMMVVLIASVAMIIAFFSAQAIFGSFGNQTADIQTVEAISSEVEEPDPAIFNEKAINPTWNVSVGNESTDTTEATSTDDTTTTPADQ